MTIHRAIARLVANEDLNFLLTNRLPRRLATSFIGWFGRLEHPWIAKPTIAAWRLFSDVDLTDAEQGRFASMHACFTRRLRAGARPIDPDPSVLVSPCDAIVGAFGAIEPRDRVHQIKGAPYHLSDLLGSAEAARPFYGGRFVTLRLTAGMYHHFHAPADLRVEEVTYRSGDCWNVNPVALKRVEHLFCKNERAALRCCLPDGAPLTLVAVAAVLVASIRFTFMEDAVRTGGSRTFPVRSVFGKGDEMGWFEQGSTIIVLLPPGWTVQLTTGDRLHMGQALATKA